MGSISIAFPTPLLDRVRILAAARNLDVEAFVLKAVAQSSSGLIRGWRGEWLIAIFREGTASLDTPIAGSLLLDQWTNRYPRGVEDFETAILELVADGILLPDQQLGYSLTAEGRRLLWARPD